MPTRGGCLRPSRCLIRGGATIRSSWTTPRCQARCVAPMIRPSWCRWCGWARITSSPVIALAGCTERGRIQVKHTVSRMLLAAALAFGVTHGARAAHDLVVGLDANLTGLDPAD